MSTDLHRLIEELNGPAPDNFLASDKLVRIGEPAIPLLVMTLLEGHPRAQDTVRATLERIGEPAIQPLLEVLRLGDPQLQVLAIRALQQIKGGIMQAHPFLKEMLTSEHEEVRLYTSGALLKENYAVKEAFVVLVNLLATTDKHLRFSVIMMLDDTCRSSRIDLSGVVPVLSDMLDNPDSTVRQRATIALQQIATPEARAALAKRR
ncbi:MAG: HEAT repeat domain-containing protein [Chloroflexi bacterium]|nr:HEAT repeat domain-containing protein [Chloroflexota bacterium]